MVADSGKKIPLIPGTKNPHVCPEKKGEQPPSLVTETKPEVEYVPPKPSDFDDKVIQAEVKRVSVWARAEANSINFPENFNKNSATHDELRARQIDRNVDKKDLMHYFFEVKYGKKKNSVDKLP